MFTVGEFSKLAQVSKRLLRYYDEIGLLTPIHTDPLTGYRYYNAEQMVQLNRIIVLKELGLSLDQVWRVLQSNISTDELQGMLLLKKVEIEQRLQEEGRRIRSIESRLQAIRNTETQCSLNVVVKQVRAQFALSVRTQVGSFEEGLSIFKQIRTSLPQTSAYGLCFTICRGGSFSACDMELELGRMIEAKIHDLVPLGNGLQLAVRELPAVPVMATCVIVGALESIHIGYTGIGVWAEAHDYHLAGRPREVTLQVPQNADGSDLVTEIQFPVELAHQT